MVRKLITSRPELTASRTRAERMLSRGLRSATTSLRALVGAFVLVEATALPGDFWALRSAFLAGRDFSAVVCFFTSEG